MLAAIKNVKLIRELNKKLYNFCVFLEVLVRSGYCDYASPGTKKNNRTTPQDVLMFQQNIRLQTANS